MEKTGKRRGVDRQPFGAPRDVTMGKGEETALTSNYKTRRGRGVDKRRK